MAVVTDAISIVIQVEDLEEIYPGGLEGYIGDVPNATFCCDGLLTRVGFMNPDDAQSYGERLAAAGLPVEATQESRVAVVDQRHGSPFPWEWVESTLLEGGIRIARVTGDDRESFVAPPDWEPDESRDLVANWVSPDEIGRTVHRIGEYEEDREIFYDESDGRLKFHGRVFKF